MKQVQLLIITIFLLGFQAKSQEVMAETGLSFTTFDYKNSQGETLDNLQATTNNYLSLGYRHNLVNNVLHLVGGLGINSYGATGSDHSVNNYFKWETTYLGVFAGLDVKIYNTDKLSFYLRGTTSSEFMLQGTQTLNNQVFDLKGVEEFDTANFFFRGGAIIEYSISDSLSIFTKYNYGKSTSNGTDEDLKYTAHEVGFGLVLKFAKPKPTDSNIEEETTNTKL